jgi:hypothetical protein
LFVPRKELSGNISLQKGSRMMYITPDVGQKQCFNGLNGLVLIEPPSYCKENNLRETVKGLLNEGLRH